eukprot:g3469.t1
MAALPAVELEGALEHDVDSSEEKLMGIFKRQHGGHEKMGSAIAWRGVNYTIQSAGKAEGERKAVLINNTGVVVPGELCCIMGPSGAGKSSLLNVLAGRVISSGRHSVSGHVLINGAPVAASNVRMQVAYVMQDDAIMATATPREAMRFSAALRLGSTVSLAEREKLVEDMIEALSLGRCADTHIGDARLRGVSGGERKRCSIGVELITLPRLLFLDEPTSGLDSFAAFKVVSLLRSLARSGCTVLCTLHQPSSEIIHLFDSAVMLESGQTVYRGSVSQMPRVLHCPAHNNPADWAMFLIQTDLPRVRRYWQEALAAGLVVGEMAGGEEGGRETAVVAPPAGAAGAAKAASGAANALVPAVPAAPAAPAARVSFCAQLRELVRRELRQTVRDKEVLGARLGINLFLSIIMACLFLYVGDASQPDYQLVTHFGAVTNVAILAMMSTAQPMLLTFPYERPVFVREYNTGTYDVAPYFVAKLAVEAPLALLSATEVWLVIYWAMGFHGGIAWMVVVHWLMALVTASVAIMVGCLIANVQQAMEAVPAIFVPQILFSGFFVRTEQMPVWLSWAQYLCFLKYGLNLMMINEFGPGKCGGTDPQGRALQPQCDALLEQNDVNPSMEWAYYLILLAAFVAYRCLALTCLKRRARLIYA